MSRICQRDGCTNLLTPRQQRWCRGACRRWGYDQAHRASCVECGAKLGPGTARADGSLTNKKTQLCRLCLRRDFGRAERVVEVMRRYQGGESVASIAEGVGYTTSTVNVLLSWLRALGFDLPRIRSGWTHDDYAIRMRVEVAILARALESAGVEVPSPIEECVV